MWGFAFVNNKLKNSPVLYSFRLRSQKFVYISLCILVTNKEKNKVLIAIGRLPVEKTFKVVLQPKNNGN